MLSYLRRVTTDIAPDAVDRAGLPLDGRCDPSLRRLCDEAQQGLRATLQRGASPARAA